MHSGRNVLSAASFFGTCVPLKKGDPTDARRRARDYASSRGEIAPIMQTAHHDKRTEERVSTELPVDLGTATGVTRDVSASGIFFETDASYAVGNEIDLTVEFDTPGGKMMLKAHGNIVRIERRDAKVGVAVKITESKMEPAE